MSTNKSKKPELRFKGFSDDWEQRKLVDFCDMFNGDRGVNYPKDADMVTDGIPFVNAGDLQEGKVNLTTANKITREKFEQLGGAKIKRGDILYCLRGTLGKNAFVDNFDEGTVASSLVDIRAKNIYPQYLFTVLNSDIEYRQRILCDEGAAQPNLSATNLANFDIPVPQIEEQRKIGAFFKNLDSLITLHQRKCENLIIIKKSMLDNLFPKNGEKVPRWRFKGFNDDWEQCKLGEIFEEYSEKNHEELPALTIIQGGGTILREESNRNMQYERSSLSGYKMVKKDDFILHLRSFEGGLEKANTNGIISPAYHTFHGENTDSRFYYSFFRSKYFIDVLLKPHVYGIRDGKSIDVEGMKSILVPVPTYNEQKYIGDFVERTDNLITLHQSEVERLKKVKQFFLDKMFI